MRQKVPYGVFGFLCGMFVAVMGVIPILQLITHKQQNPVPGFYLFIIILVLGVIGVLIGLKFDAYINGGQQQGAIPKIAIFLTKYFSPLIYGKRRAEGNFVIYETNNSQNFVVIIFLALYFLFLRRYIPQPYGDILYWVVIVAWLIGSLPMANDSVKAISRKIITNTAGKKEVWYEMPKNEDQ